MTWRMVIMGVRPRREQQFCSFGNDSLAAASPHPTQSDLSSLAGPYRKTCRIPTLENNQSERRAISDHEARDLIQPARTGKNQVGTPNFSLNLYIKEYMSASYHI